MHSYAEPVSYLPMYAMEDRLAAARRPLRVAVAAASFALMACVAVLVVAGEGDRASATELVPKFVDWKKEDAGSDDMNLHLKVADALAKADGLAEKGLSPVPEGLLKEAQQAAEEQKTMPGVTKEDKKPTISAGLEKMFQQAMDEQHVEKLAKEGGEAKKKAQKADAEKKAAVKAQAQKKVQEESAKATASEEKKDSIKLLKQVSEPATTQAKAAAPANAAAPATAPVAAAPANAAAPAAAPVAAAPANAATPAAK